MRLQNTQKLVEELLKAKPETRSNDNILFLEVIKKIGTENGIDVSRMSVTELFTSMHSYGFPQMESVRRARQKLQASFPELRPSDEVLLRREMNEEEYKAYVRRKYT